MKKFAKMFYKLSALMMCTVLIVCNMHYNTYAENTDILITANQCDSAVMPDKYNTGCTGELTTVSMAATMDVGDILLVAGSNSTVYVLDFVYRNKDITGTVYIENYDFSEYKFSCYHDDMLEREIKVVFNNCKFASAGTGRTGTMISYEFNNCTFNSFSGSNATFNNCSFGGNYTDGLVPFRNISVNNCFFSDFTSVSTDAGAHIDGTQLYGYADSEVNNVTYTNCRFEIPPLHLADSNAYVNAALMLQIEFNNAVDVIFKDCTINGGGYSIYANNKFDGLTFTNVAFDGITYGCAYKYGVVYTKINKDIEFKNFSSQDSLYVGSVWKDTKGTHISVTNDTNVERTLLVYADESTYTYTIPACSTGSEVTEDMRYDDMPFDIDIVIPSDCGYVVCFDSTVEGLGKQLRYINWGDSQVYLPSDMADTLYSGGDDILVSGTCGKDITFTLTKSGVLTLTGTGDTYNYHSAKFPDWIDYKDYIKEVYVGEGITGLGSMIFRQHSGIKNVTLPSTLKSIGQYAFGGCVCLSEFTIPANVTELGKSVMSGTILSQIKYEGDDWYSVTYGTGNDGLVERIVYDVPADLIYGDANRNGVVDVTDAVVIKKYLSSIDTNIYKIASDVNADNILDVKDAVKLLKHIAGEDVTLGQP